MAVKLNALANSTPENAVPEVLVQCVFPTSGNYTGGGEPCDLTAIKDPNLIGVVGPSEYQPLYVIANVMNTAGYTAQFTIGTTLKNGVLRLFAANGTEFSGAFGTPWSASGSYVVLRIG